MYANLQGDYIKGKDLSNHSDIVQEGILLHRTIDDFIDTHPAVKAVMNAELYPVLPKISGIAIDLYFDHLLARDWDSYHPVPLREFVNAFYEHTPHFSETFSAEFRFMLDKMKEFDWLYEYQHLSGLRQASTGLSRRISFKNKLGDATEIFVLKQKEIEEAFHLFIHDAHPFFENYFKKI